MTQLSLPWDSTSPGDAGAYSSAQWAQGWRYLMGLAAHRANVGVMLGSGDSGVEGLHVQATSPASANIEVTTGSALVNGRLYINDATETLTVGANGSGNPRIDTVVLQADFTAQTVRLILKAGATAVSPTPPALTQTANVLWEIPLADVAVASGFVSIADTDISARAEYANAADGVYLDMVLNNSGAELNTGDVVVWDTTANRAIKTTTTSPDTNVAGVWQGRTANGGYGRVLTDGIGLVRVNAAVATRGSLLATSTTAKQAAITSALVTAAGTFAFTLETTGGAGLCLAYVRTALRPLLITSEGILLGHTETGGDVANFDLTSLPATFRHLRLRLFLRSTAAAADNVYLRLNNDSTATNYFSASTYAHSTALVTGTQRLGGTGTAIEMHRACATDTAGVPSTMRSAVDVMLWDYAQTGKYRLISWNGGAFTDDSNNTFGHLLGSGFWINTADAINRLTILPVSGSNWKAGSAYALYGVN